MHLRLRWRITAIGYICVIVKMQRERRTVALKKKRENKKSPLFFFPPAALVKVEQTLQNFVLGLRWRSVSLLVQGGSATNPEQPVMWINEEQVMKGLQRNHKTQEPQQSRAGSRI